MKWKVEAMTLRDGQLDVLNERLSAVLELHLNSGFELVAINGFPRQPDDDVYIATIFFKRAE